MKTVGSRAASRGSALLCIAALSALGACGGNSGNAGAYALMAGTTYAIDGCSNMCTDPAMACNRETRLCERIPCHEGCGPGLVCDEFLDECVAPGR